MKFQQKTIKGATAAFIKAINSEEGTRGDYLHYVMSHLDVTDTEPVKAAQDEMKKALKDTDNKTFKNVSAFLGSVIKYPTRAEKRYDADLTYTKLLVWGRDLKKSDKEIETETAATETETAATETETAAITSPRHEIISRASALAELSRADLDTELYTLSDKLETLIQDWEGNNETTAVIVAKLENIVSYIETTV